MVLMGLVGELVGADRMVEVDRMVGLDKMVGVDKMVGMDKMVEKVGFEMEMICGREGWVAMRK